MLVISKVLYAQRMVNLDERSLQVGGSWTANGVYDQPLVAFIADKMSKMTNPCLVDVGASTGSFSLLPRFVGGEVVCFEPNPEIYKILCINLQLNDLTRQARAFNIALHAYDGKARLKIPRNQTQSGLATLGKPATFSKFNKLDVACRKLDSMRIGKVDIIKVDTEGCEWHILAGARQTIQRNHPGILLEFNERNASQFEKTPQMLVDFLKTLGYMTFQKVGREDLWAM